MKMLYLDMCVLKRPFDDQSDTRIWIETQAILRILEAVESNQFKAVSSSILEFENDNNPNPVRKERVMEILTQFDQVTMANDAILQRASNFTQKGLPVMDAAHLAAAEHAKADFFITCDDRLLRKTLKLKFRYKITDPLSLLKELSL